MGVPSHPMPFVRRDRRLSGFTLIELLAVMAIIVLLVAFSVNGIQGAKQRAAIGRAKGELAHLSQALEAYKRHYGDYPQAGPSAANAQKVTLAASGASAAARSLATPAARLLNALIGVYGPTNFTTRLSGPTFVDVSKLTLEVPFSSSTQTTTNTLAAFAVPHRHAAHQDRAKQRLRRSVGQPVSLFLLSAGRRREMAGAVLRPLLHRPGRPVHGPSRRDRCLHRHEPDERR